jgi:endonuclease/exonuclease/phosphatase family metal-dependent hydrolase
VIGWLIVVPGVLWTALRLSGPVAGWPLTPLMAFTPYALVAMVVPLGVTLLLRQWWAAGVALAVVATLAAVVLPRGFGGPDPAGTARGPQLRVMTMNMRFGGADPNEIVQLVRDNHVDLLALQEYTNRAVRALRAAGLESLLPVSVQYPQQSDRPGGSALYSRFPLTDTGYRQLSTYFGQAYATVQVPGAPPLLVESVHPCAPSGESQMGCWRDGLAQEPRASRTGPVRLLMGDFNATLDHSPLQSLLRSGYRDAAATLGDGFVTSWPYDGTLLPPVTLDHVLADPRIAIRSLSVHTVRNTDHRSVLADLTLPAGDPTSAAGG